MNRINYFLPYDKNSEKHEDHLSRAFLALLRLSPTAMTAFHGMVKEALPFEFRGQILPMWTLVADEISVVTQVSYLPEGEVYVSVLITDEPGLDVDNISVKPVDRKARYDGVIRLGKTVFFIENKPFHKNVWKEQLCPSRKDLPGDDTGSHGLISKPAVLEWKEIINMLHCIAELPISSYHEKVLIGDFLQYVNQSYNWLNPYDSFKKCNDDAYLIKKRIQKILSEVATNPDSIDYHMGWADYIPLNYWEIKQLPLCLHFANPQDWQIEIICVFGSTGWQAKYFYEKVKSWQLIESLQKSGWYVRGDFHLAVQSDNIIDFDTPDENLRTYFEYWCDVWNTRKGVQISRDNVQEYLQDLANKGLINFDDAKREEMEIHLSKRYQKFNICPSLWVSFNYGREDCISKDVGQQLINEIKLRMKEALSVLGNPTAEFIKE